MNAVVENPQGVAAAAQGTRVVRFSIYRYDPDRDDKPRMQTFEVRPFQGMMLRDALLEIKKQDESFAFREHRARWLYTGITRAAERLTVVV